MITRTTVRLLRVSTQAKYPAGFCLRSFSTTPDKKAKNKIYTPVRRPDDFETYKLLSSSVQVPLLTFWTASYCATCRSVSPILEELIKSGVGEEEGGVAFCEIEYDSPDVMESGLGMTYMITSMPTLLSFDRGEAQLETKVTDPRQMKNQEWLKQWIRTEAERRGSGGSGGNHPATGIFGGLFGSPK